MLVQSLDWEDSLEKAMTTYSSILAWRIPWTEEPGRLHAMGLQESDMTERSTRLCLAAATFHQQQGWCKKGRIREKKGHV